MTTYFLNHKSIKKNWLLIDAKNAVVGRLASVVAKILRGKNKPEYTPHIDCGDNIVIINAEKVSFSGKKMTDKIYYRHTGYPGGIKSTTPKKVLAGKTPQDVIRLAVKRMLDDGPLARERLSNLYIYSGTTHKHEAQKPETLDFASLNKKNTR
jgi:large subunit ribosomal protein L13